MMDLHIGMLLFPRLTQLDLTGPYEVFARLPGTQVSLLWKTLDAVTSDSGMSILPTRTFAECGQLDVVCVPGGPGTLALMEDEEALSFLRRQSEKARYVTSVCTGSLVLAAAGLLQGHRAACHWMSRELLADLGVSVVPDRYVVDGNRVTGGGVTAGIDFGLQLAAMLRGDEQAKRIQLHLEYNPAPPFNSGSPESAGPDLVHAVRLNSEKLQESRREVVSRLKRQMPRYQAL